MFIILIHLLYDLFDLGFLIGVLVFLGQKFPKSMEISLSATITFGAKNHAKQPFDHICIGGTAYLKVNILVWLTTLETCPFFLNCVYLIDF